MNGEWHLPANSKPLVDPFNGEEFMKIPDPQINEVEPFVQSLRKVPKTGLHNPLKNPERYVQHCLHTAFVKRCSRLLPV